MKLYERAENFLKSRYPHLYCHTPDDEKDLIEDAHLLTKELEIVHDEAVLKERNRCLRLLAEFENKLR